VVQTYVWDAADISDIQYLWIFNKTAVKLLVVVGLVAHIS